MQVKKVKVGEHCKFCGAYALKLRTTQRNKCRKCGITACLETVWEYKEIHDNGSLQQH